MEVEKIAGVDLLDFGNEVTIAGALYHGRGEAYILLFPDADCVSILEAADRARWEVLSPIEWNALIRQSDELNVRGLGRIILKKGVRIIDQSIAWAVYRRDVFECRYCRAADRPLTVDHVDLWEDGGATIEANLVAACRPCNRARGRTPYEEWIVSEAYIERSKELADHGFANRALVERLPELRKMRVAGPRSR